MKARGTLAADLSYTPYTLNVEVSDDNEEVYFKERGPGGGDSVESDDQDREGDKDMNDGSVTRYTYGGCRRTVRRAVEHRYRFMNTGFNPQVKRRNKEITDESVKESVQLLFSNDNRQVLTHDSKL